MFHLNQWAFHTDAAQRHLTCFFPFFWHLKATFYVRFVHHVIRKGGRKKQRLAKISPTIRNKNLRWLNFLKEFVLFFLPFFFFSDTCDPDFGLWNEHYPRTVLYFPSIRDNLVLSYAPPTESLTQTFLSTDVFFAFFVLSWGVCSRLTRNTL